MTILFIGLGAMGEPMATNLAAATDIVVYDVDSELSMRVAASLGVHALESLDALPEGVTAIFLMVPSSRIVESLLIKDAKLLNKLPAGSLIVDMSSSDPGSTRELALSASGRAIAYVDAPVSGGVTKARTGELTFMVGAEPAALARVRPMLATMGTNIIHVGTPGAGDAAKALNNLLSATNIAATAEVVAAAANFGISPEVMIDVINASTGRSQASEVKFPTFILTGTFASGFNMDLMLKDLAIAKTLTSGSGLATPVTDVAADVANRARKLAGSPPDHTEIIRYYEDANHVSIRTDR